MNEYLDIKNYTEFFDTLLPISISFTDGRYSSCDFPSVTLDMLDMIDKNEQTGETILVINVNKWLTVEKLEKDPNDEDTPKEWDNLDYLIEFLQDCKNRRNAAAGV